MADNLKKKELEKRIKEILEKLPASGKGKEYKGHPNPIEYFKANYHLFLVYSFSRVDSKLYERLKSTKLIKPIYEVIEAIKKTRSELVPGHENELYYRSLATYLRCSRGVIPPAQKGRTKKDDMFEPKSIDDELGEREEE